MRNSFLKSSVLLLGVVLFALSQTVSAQKFGKIEDWECTIGAPVGYEEASAVILFSKAVMSVSSDQIETNYHLRMKILTKAGADEIGNIEILYDKGYAKFKDFEAHTILSDGTKVKVDKSAIFEKEFGDIVTVTFSFPQALPGSIVEYKYVIRSKNFYQLDPWYFQSSIYTYKSVFSVELWPGFSYHPSYRGVPFDKQQPKVDQRPDPDKSMGLRFIKIFTWELDKLLPVDDEPYMSCENDYRASIRFQLISFTDPYGSVITFVKNWSDIGVDFTKFIDDYCNQNKEVKKLADSLTVNLTDQREKSQALFDYVAQSVKTTKSPGRWFANDKMSKMFETGAETKEAKNVLLSELHKAIGIDAWPVLISTRKHGKFDPAFASSQQFNTMVTFVQIGNAWEFLDASNGYAPYGILPPQCLTDGGLLIDGANSELVRITIQQAGSYRTDVTVTHVAADGSTDCKTHSEFGGYYAAEYADRYDEAPHEEFIEKYYKDRVGGSCAIRQSVCKLDSANHFIASVEYTADDMVKMLDENIQIEPVNLAFQDNPFTKENRFFPVDFTYPFIYHNQNEFIFETPATSYVLPPDISEKITGASFARQSVTTDSSAIIITQLRVDKAEFPQANYGGLREFFDKYVRAANEKVTAIVEN